MRRLFAVEALRYLAVGGSLFVLSASVLYVLSRGLGLDLRVAEGLSRATGAAVGFFAHRYLTFLGARGQEARPVSMQGLSYVAVTVSGLVISPWLLWGLYQALSPHLLVAKVLCDGIMLIQTFILLRLVFASSSKAT
jgi:putative flippase GtrA